MGEIPPAEPGDIYSYSRDILSPCTPDLFMVKDVVKSEYRMIVMWSCFQVVEAFEICSAGREKCIESREETHQPPHVVNHLQRDDNYVVRKIKQTRAENYFVPLLQVLYCNLQSQLCQVLFSINSALKI